MGKYHTRCICFDWWMSSPDVEVLTNKILKRRIFSLAPTAAVYTSHFLFVVQYAADPRFKLMPFTSERTHCRARAATAAVMERIHESASNDFSTTSLSASSILTNSGPTLQPLTSAASTFPPVDIGSPSDTSSFIPTSMLLHQQLAAYASEAVIPRTDCPLTWWADNWQKYPLVFEVARRLLVIPAVTVCTERLYTKKGDEFMDKRDAISPEKADQVLFIMENL